MNRKALYIGLFLFAAALVGCSKEQTTEPKPEPTPAAEPKAVGFRIGGDELTRGGVISEADEILSLGIFGYSTGTEDFSSTYTPNLFDNKEATRTGASSLWEYDDPVFWPTDDTHKNTFFAYSPYQDDFPAEADFSATLSGGTYGYPLISYTVPGTVSEQVDLLYSEHLATATDGKLPTANINYGTNTTNPGHVKFNMKHATIWIRFIIAAVAEVDPDEIATAISEGTLPADSKETYTMKSFYFSGDNIYADGTFNMGTGTWSYPNAKRSATYLFDKITRAQPLIVDAGVTTPLSLADHSLMVIPQDFVYDTDATNVSFMYTHDNPLDPSNTEFYVTLPFPDVKLGSAGYVMTYIVKISTSGAWIEFESTNTIEEWLTNEELREIEVF